MQTGRARAACRGVVADVSYIPLTLKHVLTNPVGCATPRVSAVDDVPNASRKAHGRLQEPGPAALALTSAVAEIGANRRAESARTFQQLHQHLLDSVWHVLHEAELAC